MFNRPIMNIEENPLVDSLYAQQFDVGVNSDPPSGDVFLITDGSSFLLTDGTPLLLTQ